MSSRCTNKEDEDVQRICKSMERASAHEVVDALANFQRIAKTPNGNAALRVVRNGDYHPLQEVSAAMKAHYKTNTEVVVMGCGVLKAMTDPKAASSSEDEGRKAASMAAEISFSGVTQNGVKAGVVLFNVLDKYKSVELQVACCAALTNMMAVCTHNWIEMKEVKKIVAIMKANLQESALQEAGCGIIGHKANFQARDTSKDYEENLEFLNSGIVEAVIEALKAHMKNADVQAAGLFALCSLAGVEDDGLDDDAEHGCLGPDCCMDHYSAERVVQALDTHRQNAKVQTQGFNAMCRLAQTETQENIDWWTGGVGGAQAVVRALEDHRKDPEVLQAVFLALVSISKGAKRTNAVALIAAGSSKAVRKAMELHPKHAMMQVAGCAVLSILADSSDVEATLPVLAAAAVAHRGEATAVEYVTKAVEAIASSSRDAGAVKRAFAGLREKAEAQQVTADIAEAEAGRNEVEQRRQDMEQRYLEEAEAQKAESCEGQTEAACKECSIQ